MQVLLFHLSFKTQKTLVMELLVYWDGVRFPTVFLLFVATTQNFILYSLHINAYNVTCICMYVYIYVCTSNFVRLPCTHPSKEKQDIHNLSFSD